MSERALVTGGAGFIGSHTVDRLLERGYAVRVLDRLHAQVHPGGAAPTHLSPEAEMRVADVRDLAAMRDAVRDVDVVVHLAAETSVGQSLYECDHHVDVNARGTATLFRAIREAGGGVRRVVLSSSRAVYGEGLHRCPRCGERNPGPRRREDLDAGRWTHRCADDGEPLRAVATTEATPARFASAYGMTKRFQEQVAALEATQQGLELTTLRYFNVYGPRQSLTNPYTGLICTFALRLLAGKPLVLYEQGTPVRDFVFVDDVARANILALEPSADGARTLNVGSGVATSLGQLAAALGRALAIEPMVERSDRFRVGDVHAAVADVSAARLALGYVPSVDLEEGLATLVEAIASAGAADGSDAVEAELRRRGVLRGDAPAAVAR